MATWIASTEGREQIQQARARKGWTVKADEMRPLQEASKFLLRQHQQVNGWTADDPAWLKNFEYLVRLESPQAIDEIKRRLVQALQGSILNRIEQLIDAGEVYAKDVSYGTWSRFASPTKAKAIKERAFKAYCQILELDWQAIVAAPIVAVSNETPITTLVQATNPLPSQLSTQFSSPILHNLPAGDYSTFIGRQAELQELLQLLTPNSRTHRIALCGTGGIGKTTLLLEAAYRCLKASLEPEQSDIPRFEAIIFTSSKPDQLLTRGILPRQRRSRSLQDIFRAIAQTLNCRELLVAELDDQLDQIYGRLGQQPTLLLLDNLDTVEEIEPIRSFLCDLPLTVKVIVTSRVQELFDVTLELEPLPRDEGLALIQHQSERKRVLVSPEDAIRIYQQAGGLPMAIVYTMGQAASGYPLNSILTCPNLAMEELTRYCFESSVTQLTGQPAHRLLMAIALFPSSVSSEAAAFVADIPNASVLIHSFAQLQQRSLVNRSGDRHRLQPLTRTYSLAELAAQPDFEQQARSRWVDWAIQFVRQYGGEDWQEWRAYHPLEAEWENLREVVDYCVAQERWDDFRSLWSYLKGYTHTYGYWNERLVWINGLIQAAEQRQDQAVLVEALFDKARTFVLFNQPAQLETAIALCNQAWGLSGDQSVQFRFDLLISLALLHIQLQQFDAAQAWLDQGTMLLAQLPGSESTDSRQQIYLLYYRAQIYLETEAYDTAEQLYQQALEQATAIGWQKAVTYINDWLAVVAIKQRRFTEAEGLLTTGLTAAEQNNDQRCIAFCQRSLALLEKARGDLGQAHHWATLARAQFHKLQMFQDTKGMDAFLQNEE